MLLNAMHSVEVLKKLILANEHLAANFAFASAQDMSTSDMICNGATHFAALMA